MRPASLRQTLRLAAPALLALALPGCISLGGGKAPPTLMNLSADAAAPAGAGAAGKAENALVVLDPDTDRRLAVTRVAVAVDPANVAYVKNAQWVEPPARLFRALLAETIRTKGTRLVFEDDEAAASGRTRLSGRLLDMGYDAQARAAVVRYDAILAKPGSAITTRRFEARVDGVEPEGKAIGPALNRAANDVARQVADWVG
jgi:cholesterol transport system auxiliary component